MRPHPLGRRRKPRQKLFDNSRKLRDNSLRPESEILRFNGSSQIRPVRRQVQHLTTTNGVQEVLGSNPSAPTKLASERESAHMGGFLCGTTVVCS